MSDLYAADFFVLRTPAVSWQVVRDWSEGLTAAQAHRCGGELAAAISQDEELLRSRLRELVARPQLQEAIFVASPSLHAQLQAWLHGDDGEKARAVEPAVVRYLVRMAGRCTPFGLFAGYTIGRAGARTNLALPAANASARHTRLNLDVLYGLAATFARRRDYQPHVRYHANTTVYRVGDRLRYHAVAIEPSAVGSVGRRYSLREISANAFTEVALRAGRHPAGGTIDELAAAIVHAHDDVDADDARTFVRRLIGAHLFWPSLLPPITGADPTCHLRDELRALPNAEPDVTSLEAVMADIAALDSVAWNAITHTTRCTRIAANMRALGASFDAANLLKVDLRKPATDVTLNDRVLCDIAAAVELVAAIAPEREPPLHAFARRFEERYHGREVPLLEALDPESGIGFEHVDTAPSSIVRGLELDAPDERSWSWGKRDAFLLRKLVDALQSGASQIELTDADVALLVDAKRLPLPAGQTAVVSLAARSTASLDEGDYRLFIAAAGQPTSAALLGRFLNDDPELARHVRATLVKEADVHPDAIHAEIAHHVEELSGPWKRATNVSLRPVLRDYEIDVVGASGAPASRRIPVDDLLLCVDGDQIVLRSARLGRRVIPHLSSAHAFDQPGCEIYRFLARMQTQDVATSLAWSWGRALADVPFLPRLTYGRIVLALATWRLSADLVESLRQVRGADRFRAIQSLRDARRLPRTVGLVDGDNVLPVDLENVMSIDGMLSACRGGSPIVLRETFPDAGELVARGPDGVFLHELLVPVLRARAPTQIAPSSSRAIAASPHRAELPGDEWLFAKVYCGTATADRFLVDVLAPLLRDLRADGLVDDWFFVRYRDPDCHLRIRFRGERSTLWGDASRRFFDAAATMRPHLHKLTIDGYDPEVERYGGAAAMAVAHAVFVADSDAALEIVTHCRGDADTRWQAALLAIDALLDDFGFTLLEKRSFTASARERSAVRIGAGARTRHRLGELFRGKRRELERLWGAPPSELAAAIEALAQRSRTVRRALSRLHAIRDGEQLTVPFSELVQSYVHMSVNRVLRAAPNEHELALHDMLFRLYDGAVARRSAG